MSVMLSSINEELRIQSIHIRGHSKIRRAFYHFLDPLPYVTSCHTSDDPPQKLRHNHIYPSMLPTVYLTLKAKSKYCLILFVLFIIHLNIKYCCRSWNDDVNVRYTALLMHSVAGPDACQPLTRHRLGNLRSADRHPSAHGQHRHQHLQPAWHGRGYHSLIPLGIHSHQLSACWQSGSAVCDSLTDTNPWLWFHLAKHSVTRQDKTRQWWETDAGTSASISISLLHTKLITKLNFNITFWSISCSS